MPVYRIDLAYDGSGFRGYAANPGVRTVQGELEQVLAVVLRHEVPTVVAGRTDAGVHARGQVLSFSVEEPVDMARLQRAVNRRLAPEIVVKSISEAAAGFSARFSAWSRTYRYMVDDAEVPDPARRWTAWHVPGLLDVGAMDEAAACLVGEHDFASLCRAAEGKTTTRVVHTASWWREEVVVFEVSAASFCHQMVRSMVALCVEVGRGRLEVPQVLVILEERDRNAARGAAPPHGLTLWSVEY
jgi:tRNA pseudouridine38-40 synthase